MKPIKILALILATTVFFSCSEDSEPIKILEETTKLLKYNSNGYIKSITTYNSNNIETLHSEYEYNTANQIIKRIGYKTEKRTKWRVNYFTYDVNGYVKTIKEGEEAFITTNFDYEIAGNSIKVKDKYKNNILRTYEYKNGNLLFVELDPTLDRTDFLNYDNKKNPYYEGFPLSFSIIMEESKNNILKAKRSGANLDIRINYQYEYNSENLPTKITTNYTIISGELDPTNSIVHYKYEK